MKYLIYLENSKEKTIGKLIEEITKKTIVDLVKVSESSYAMTVYNQLWKVKFEDQSEKYVEVQIDFEKNLMIISL